MKTTLALVLATLSLAACAAPNAAEETSVETTAVTAVPEGTTYRGSFDAFGGRYSLEVVVTSKQTVKQIKYCDPGSGANDPAFAGSYATPDYSGDLNGGTVRTIVRDAGGAIVGESSYAITSFSASNYGVDVDAQCKGGGRRVADFAPVTTFALANPLVWIPGVVVSTAQGPLWINPSYGGVARVGMSFAGTATYRSLSTETTLRSRPFDGEGQELVFAKGELTFHAAVPQIDLEIGTDVDATGSHARDVRTVTLARQ